jgi:membrane protease YdiL (CAAX protease family)
MTDRDEQKAGWILAAIAGVEGAWVLLNVLHSPIGFLRYTGFVGASAEPVGWLAAVVVFILATVYAAKLPSVRANLFTFSFLKVLALLVAVTAGFCEEAVFRKFLMDDLAQKHLGLTVQIVGFAVAFGLVHGIAIRTLDHVLAMGESRRADSNRPIFEAVWCAPESPCAQAG